MLDLLSALLRSGGFQALSRHSGLDGATVNDAAGELIPAQFEAMRRFAQAHGGGARGVDRLLAMIDELGDGEMAAVLLGHDPVVADPGKALIRRLFPAPGEHDAMIGRVAFESGQDRETVSRLSPYAMMLLAGYLSARAIASRAAGEDDDRRGLGAIHDALAGNGAGD